MLITPATYITSHSAATVACFGSATALHRTAASLRRFTIAVVVCCPAPTCLLLMMMAIAIGI